MKRQVNPQPCARLQSSCPERRGLLETPVHIEERPWLATCVTAALSLGVRRRCPHFFNALMMGLVELATDMQGAENWELKLFRLSCRRYDLPVE